MKKKLLLAGLILMSIATYAQPSFRINGYTSYVFQDNFDNYYDVANYYSGKVNGGFQWGAGLEWFPVDQVGVELSYFREDTKAPSTFKFGATNPQRTETFNVALNNILIGANWYMPTDNEKFEGYGGILMGAVIAEVEAPSQNKKGTTDNFTWGMKLGCNVWFSPRVGLKLQAQVLSASRVNGGDVYYGWWGPVYLNTYSTLWQFGLGGGLSFKLGK